MKKLYESFDCSTFFNANVVFDVRIKSKENVNQVTIVLSINIIMSEPTVKENTAYKPKQLYTF